MALPKTKRVWERATYTRQEARALQAFVRYATGVSDDPPGADDCKRILDCILFKMCVVSINGFVPEDQNGRTAAFVDGRQFVGREIDLLSKLNPEILDD